MDGKYSYNGKFKRNILIVGQTGCEKTTFIQKLSQKMFGDLKEITKRLQKYPFLHKEKKTFLLVSKNVDFKYPQTIDEFNMHLTFFQRKRRVDNDIDGVMGENNVFDKLIVMNDVSGLADKSDDFDNFLTVPRKFSFTCVYDFHTMYPTRSR